MTGQTSFRNRIIAFWIMLSITIVTSVSTILLSKPLADTLYQKKDYKNALLFYQVHYLFLKDTDSLLGICYSAYSQNQYKTFLDYQNLVKPGMFASENDYRIILADRLVAVFMLSPENDYNFFFQEYQRLTPELIDTSSFFIPFGYVFYVDSDVLMQQSINFIEEKIPMMKVDIFKAGAYTLLAAAYDRLDQHDKAVEMIEIADQLDPPSK